MIALPLSHKNDTNLNQFIHMSDHKALQTSALPMITLNTVNLHYRANDNYTCKSEDIRFEPVLLRLFLSGDKG